MRFKVSGAKRDTGEATAVMVEAENADEASAKANRHGILVERCDPVASSPRSSAKPPAVPSPAAVPSTSAAVSSTDQQSVRNVTPTGRSRFLRIAATISVAVFAILLSTFFFVIKPWDDARRKTLRDAVTQMDKSAEMQKKADAQQIAQLQDKMRQMGIDPKAPASVTGVEASEQSQEAKAKLAVLKRYAESAEPFVREAKAMRTRVQSGVTFDQYSDKMQTLLDAYSELPAPPDDARAKSFATAADHLLDFHKTALKRWETALGVARLGHKMSYERDLQRDWESAANATTVLGNALSDLKQLQ